MAIVSTKVKRRRDSVLIRGTVPRDTDVHPAADATFITAVNALYYDITLTTGEVIAAKPPLQNVLRVLAPARDATNITVQVNAYDSVNKEVFLTFLMNTPTYDGRVWQIFTAGVFYTKAEAEARPWPIRWPILVSVHMVNPNVPDQDKRAQPTPNDQVTVIYE